jgi:hypothetical protein
MGRNLGSSFLMLDLFASSSDGRRAFSRQEGSLTDSIRDAVDYEISRTRRYGGSLSLLAVVPGPEQLSLDGQWTRFTTALADSMREIDRCWVKENAMVVLLPAAGVDGRSHVTRRIADIAEHHEVQVQVSSCTFPDELSTSHAMLAGLLHLSRGDSD